MRVKMVVWEPGKADAFRFDRASTLDELVEILTKLNPGDELELFFIKEGTNKHDITNVPINKEVQDNSSKEVIEAFSGGFDGIESSSNTQPNMLVDISLPSLSLVVPSSKPSLYEDLYNKVIDIIDIEGWLTKEQQAIIQDEAMKLVRSHSRVTDELEREMLHFSV